MKNPLQKIALITLFLFCLPGHAWATNASATPAPGTVPISRSDNTLNPGWFPTGSYKGLGVYYVASDTDFANAIADSSRPVIRVITSFAMGANRTVPAGQVLDLTMETVAITTTGWTLTINGYFPDPGPVAVFAGTGTVTFGSVALDKAARPQWFGGGSSGATAATAATPNIIPTLTVNSATPDVSALGGVNGTFQTANTSATTITQFSNGTVGQRITIIANDAYTSVQFGTNILGLGGSTSNLPLSLGDSLSFIYDTYVTGGTTYYYWHCTSPAISGTPIYRNRLINGEMRIDQRNVGASQTLGLRGSPATGAESYTVDRWYSGATGTIGATYTGQQVTGSGQWKNCYTITGATNLTNVWFGQRIESINVADMGGATATLSAYIVSSAGITVTWAAYYAGGPDTWTSATQIATGTFTTTTGSLARYSATMSLPSSAVNGVSVVFSFGALTSGTVTITGAQFEPGVNATLFERRPDDVELLRCMRYLPSFQPILGGGAASMYPAAVMCQSNGTTASTCIFPLPVQARANLTGVTVQGSGSPGFVYKADGQTQVAVTAGDLNISGTNPPTNVTSMAVTLTTAATSLTAGYATFFYLYLPIYFTGAEL